MNRISLGVQSTHEHHLKYLGRIHNADEAHAAITLAQRHVPRVSADLICGLPTQTMSELAADIELYRRHNLQHASVYHLTIEPGTEFHAAWQRGQLQEISDEQGAEHLTYVRDALRDLGLHDYETSNFSASGHESRHNLAYWQQHDYHACGAGAVSTLQGVRETRHKHPAKYISEIMDGQDAIWRSETLSNHDIIYETWMCGLRLTSGVAKAALKKAGDYEKRWLQDSTYLIDLGYLRDTGSHLQLTDTGRPLQDAITARLLPPTP